MSKKSMDFEPWSWESDNWGGDPEGQLAKALEKARTQEPKPLKLTKLPHRDQTSLSDFADIEMKILDEIEKEGGALGMKNLTKIADETKIKTVLSKMEKDGKLFMHKDGDIYTHEPKGHMNFAESFEAQATKIDWETDGQEVDLPKTVEVPDDLDADEIADYLSEKHGFLVNTFQIKDAESFGADYYFDGMAKRHGIMSNKMILGGLAVILSLATIGNVLVKTAVNAKDLKAEDIKKDCGCGCNKGSCK